MTASELLEKAAKAAGIVFDGEWCSNDRMSVRGGGFWNPLTDDGDALRLAVTLGLRVYVYSTTAMEPGHTVVAGEQPGCHASEGHGDDAFSATRRAIVRAAAAIAQGSNGSPARQGTEPDGQDGISAVKDLSASASPATKEQQ